MHLTMQGLPYPNFVTLWSRSWAKVRITILIGGVQRSLLTLLRGRPSVRVTGRQLLASGTYTIIGLWQTCYTSLTLLTDRPERQRFPSPDSLLARTS